MTPFSTIFWDNDGVLVDTERLYFRANVEEFAALDLAFTEEDFAAYFLSTDRGTFAFLGERGYSREEALAFRVRRNERYSTLLAGGDHVLPGVVDVLRVLHGRYGMGVVTSSRLDHFELIHANSGLLPFFDFVLTNSDYERAKPDPEPYLLALARSGALPEQCVVIEDSERGLRAAKAAGLTCWVIPGPWAAAMDFALADRVLDGLHELEALLHETA